MIATISKDVEHGPVVMASPKYSFPGRGTRPDAQGDYHTGRRIFHMCMPTYRIAFELGAMTPDPGHARANYKSLRIEIEEVV